MEEYFQQFGYYTLLAFAIGFFIIGFKPLFKLATSYIPLAGLRQAAAS